jgi:hypothetical protein
MGLDLHRRERRHDRLRKYEYCPATIKTGRNASVSVLMRDLNAEGARFSSDEPHCMDLYRGEEIEITVKTPYGLSKCKGVVQWAICEHDRFGSSLGVSFSGVSDDPRDGLRMLIDSAFC